MSFTNEALCQQVASTLNAAQVPCVLWGFYAQVVSGTWEENSRSDMVFVVPDDLVDKAVEALLAPDSKLALAPKKCSDSEACSRKRETLLPTAHLHSDSPQHVKIVDPDVAIDIFAQSSALANLAPFDATFNPVVSSSRAEFARAIGPDFLLSSDTKALPWVHSSSEYPVVVPRPDIQLESYYRALAGELRRGEDETLISSLRSDVARLVRQVHRRGFLDTSLLSPSARKLFDRYKDTSVSREVWDAELLGVY